MWTLRKQETVRLEAFEMWICRNIMRIKWIRNDEMLRHVNETTNIVLLKSVKIGEVRHILRG